MGNKGWNSISKQCCGCSACADICPRNAIRMVSDSKGFVVPIIDEMLCVHCKKCQMVCQFIYSVDLFHPIEAYAATSKDDKTLMHSASGGVFYSIADSILSQGGVAVGSSYSRTNGKLSVHHRIVECGPDLKYLQGSKYVQSDTNGIFKIVKSLAMDKRIVLFSGTPCQVTACRAYLGRDFDNVYFVDIICHGVPSLDMFKGYVTYLENKHTIRIDEIKFRDKSKGWDLKGSILFTKNNKQYKKYFKTGASSYYSLFLQSQTYRESCYECPYAGELRSGDITIGDFWGIEKQHPEYLKSNGGVFDEKKGVSCLIVNSLKGQSLVENFGNGLELKKSNFMCISEKNAQLRTPSRRGNERDLILDIFKNQGYEQLDKWYHERLGFRKIIYKLYNLIPTNLEKIR